MLNLNPPSKIADTSWIQAGKSAWDWWSGEAAPSVSFKTGMNTATMKHYIDFASASGFPYMLIDAGWALAPDRNGPEDYSQLADITQVTPEIDMPELLRYAKEKNVKLWLWAHWTSVDKYMDQAFPLFEQWGIAGVKIDFMNRDDQWMVGFYRTRGGAAAAHHLMIDFHGAYKPDGLRRTYPNLMTREGVMGKEYLKWSARSLRRTTPRCPLRACWPGPWITRRAPSATATARTLCRGTSCPWGWERAPRSWPSMWSSRARSRWCRIIPEHYAGQKEFDFIKRVPCHLGRGARHRRQADGVDLAGAAQRQRLVRRLADQLG